jgi:uncharacterized membrane protein HdeD (DUF308 family)
MLNLRQILILCLISLYLVISAVTTIRFLPQAFAKDMWGYALMLVTIPAVFGNVYLTQKLAGLKAVNLNLGIGLVSALVLVIIATGLYLWPQLFSTDTTVRYLGALWVMWSFGWALGFSAYASRKPQ